MTQDAGNSFANATQVRLQKRKLILENSLNVTDAVDFYQFDLTQSQVFESSLNQLSGNSKLTLYNRDQEAIASSNEEDGEAESIVQRLKAGKYFLGVERIEGELNYQLAVRATNSTRAIDLQGSSFENAIEVEKNGSETNLTGKVSYSGEVSTESRREQFEYYKFTLVDRINVSSVLKRLQADAEFTLFNSERQVLFTSDLRNSRSESIVQELAAGVYYLRIKAKRSETRYQLDLNFSEVQLSGDSVETAESLTATSTEQTVKNVIGASDNSDFYRIDLATSGSFKLSLKQLSADAMLEVINSSGTVVASSANLSATQTELDVNLTAAVYYIKVVSISQTISTYEFSYRFEEVRQTVTRTFQESIQSAKVIETGSTTADTVESNSEDYYRVDLDKASRLDLKLDGLSANANLELLDSEGNIIDSSLNSGTQADIVLNNLNPGTYYVRVFLTEDAISTSYTLSYNLYDLPVYALSDNNQLVVLDPSLNEPGKNLAFVNITGLAEGETIEAIDFSPGTEQLFGLSNDNQLYTIDLATGAATLVGDGSLDLTGSSFGFDFDPSESDLQITSSIGSDFIDPVTGEVLDSEGLFTYAAGDVNAGLEPTLTAIAYSNNIADATTTTLYGIDTELDVLVRQNLDGELVTIGNLGIDFDSRAGFDIVTDQNGNNTAYAANNGTVYQINLVTGTAAVLTDIVTREDGTPYNLIGVAVQPV